MKQIWAARAATVTLERRSVWVAPRRWPAKLVLYFWSAVLILVAPSFAFAGGWTQPEGRGYAKISNRSLIGNKQFATNGEIEDLPDSFQDHLLSFYGEWGAAPNLTLLALVSPIGFSKFGDSGTAYVGPVMVGARHALLTGTIPLALEIHAGFRPPIGDDSLTPGVPITAFSYVPTIPSMIGDAELQAGWAHRYGWISAAAGGRFFTNPSLRPALYGNLQFGLSTSFGLTADLHLSWYHSTGPLVEANILGTGQTRYLGVGFGLSYWFTKGFALTIGGDGAAYAKANAGAPSLSFGVELRN